MSEEEAAATQAFRGKHQCKIDEVGPTLLIFRKQVILGLVESTGCTISAASTHYNFAFQKAKQETPELVVGLGRPPEKNNGGRKPKQAPAVPDSSIVTPAALLANFQRAMGTAGAASPVAGDAPAAEVLLLTYTPVAEVQQEEVAA